MWKIAVCIKQVPDVAELRFDPERRTLVREGIPAIMNPFDRPALALALRLKQERGAEITVVTMGPPGAREVLYEALGAGCDHAVHLCDPAFAGSDTLATARALRAALAPRAPDLVLCGKHTIDGETAQVGPELAELCGLPQVTGVGKLRWEDDGTLLCERESDDGHEEVRAPLPCLLTCAEHLLPPLAVRRAQIDAARERPVEVLTAADLGLGPDAVGLSGSPTWVAEIQALAPIARPPARLHRGEPAAVAQALALELQAALAGHTPEAPPSLPPPRPAPAGPPVLVVIEQTPGGALRPGSAELLGEAAALASRYGGEAVAVRLGAGGVEEALLRACAAAGADAVLSVEHPALAPYNAEAHGVALCEVITRLGPAAVLLSASERGRDLGPRAAARLGLGLVGDAIGLRIDEQGRLVQLKPAFGGGFVAPILSRTRPAMATVRPGVLGPRQGDPARRARLDRLVPQELRPGRARLLREAATLDARAARLAGARVVICVGHGIGDPKHLPLLWALSEALGGALCATRRVTDKGWLPRQLQVGLTGKVIAPEVYLGVGVRGAPNHTVGMARAGTVFAINSDDKAPIFQLATAGAVGDWAQIVPHLIDALAGREHPGGASAGWSRAASAPGATG